MSLVSVFDLVVSVTGLSMRRADEGAECIVSHQIVNDPGGDH